MQTSNSGSGMQTSNSGSGIQTGKEDSSIGNNNECCSGGNNFEGFTTGASLTVECTPCKQKLTQLMVAKYICSYSYVATLIAKILQLDSTLIVAHLQCQCIRKK